MASDFSVYQSPVLQLGSLSDVRLNLLQKKKQTAGTWAKDIAAIMEGNPPVWFGAEVSVMPPDTSPPLQASRGDTTDLESPKASEQKHGIFELAPSFSFDSASSEATLHPNEPISLEDKVIKLQVHLNRLKDKLARPFTDIEASYLSLVSDLSNVNGRVKGLMESLGKKNDENPYPSVWAALHILSGDVSMLESYGSIAMSILRDSQDNTNQVVGDILDVKEEIAQVKLDLNHFSSWSASVEATIGVFQRRFGNIKPLLSGLVNRQSSRSSPTFTTHSDLKFESLENRLKAVESTLKESNISEPNKEVLTLITRLGDLEEKIKVMENRVVGTGVQMGSQVFQSFEDLLVWVQVKVPKGRFGRHSFLEFFTLSGHVETEAGTAAYSHSQKAGFTTYIEAQLAISFKNLFPQVFGKGGSASVDDSECLPAISNGDKWNNGSTGLHHQLMRNMNDASYQLDSTIKKVLKGHPEARQLAIDCVTSSKRFVIDLIAFMSQEYSCWQQRGFTKKDAWLFVCQIVRRIFEDLQSARISARNVQDLEDSDFTTASFIYATLKCHEVMESYVRHQFHAHPHVSSVITRHLAAHFVKPDASIYAKNTALDAKVKALATKVDSHESKIKLLVATAKKGKGKGDDDAH